MAIKHNQQIQKNHFHKDWYATSTLFGDQIANIHRQRYVRVHFDQVIPLSLR
jgi:large subunit ribosomal protein L13e